MSRDDRPILIDLFCCQGGASMGYHRAGFNVIGVDIAPQPRYPFTFHQGDALGLLPVLIDRYAPAALAGSPPCQHWTPLHALNPDREYPQLIDATRDAFIASGLPWVIENVMSAPLNRDRSIRLCGGMFELRTYRHRRFEYGGGLTLTEPTHPKHVIRTATKRRRELWEQGWHVSITGDVGTYVGPEAMGIDWMTGNGLSEAIPPAYTEHVGKELIQLVKGATPDEQ